MSTDSDASSDEGVVGSTRCLQDAYEKLRETAQRYLRHERRGHTLQPTALIHEAYIRLQDQSVKEWQNPEHFCAAAAIMMRRILLNHARDRAAQKRGGDRERVPLTIAAPQADGENPLDLIALDEALVRLCALDPRQGRIVELRFFGGLSVEATARILDVSERTVMREWISARAWLGAELSEDGRDES